MTVARTTGNFFTGATIANNATNTGSEVDMLGNNTSEGWILSYVKFTSTVTAGSLDESIFLGGTTGNEAEDQSPIVGSFAPKNGTQNVPVGEFLIDRFAIGQITNNATGASATAVAFNWTLFQES